MTKSDSFNKKYYTALISLMGFVIITIPLKHNLNSFSIILFTLFSFYIGFKEKFPFKKIFKKELLIFSSFFIFTAVQFFYSKPKEFNEYIIRILSIIIFPITFSIIHPFLKKNTTNLALKILSYSAVIYSCYLIFVAFYRQLMLSPDFSTVNWYFFSYFEFTKALFHIHPTYLGLYLTLAFSYSLNVVFNERKLINILSITVLLTAILMSGSRISLFSTVIVFLFLTIKNFKKINGYLKILIFAFSISTPIIVFKYVPIVKERMIDMTFGIKNVFSYAKYGENMKYNGGLGPRIEMWDCAIKSIKGRELLGNGIGNESDKLNSCYRSKELYSYADKSFNTHNQYFNSITTGGLIGLLILLLTYIYPLSKGITRKQQLYVCFMIIIIATSLTENILSRQIGIVFFAFFNSIFFYLNNDKKIR